MCEKHSTHSPDAVFEKVTYRLYKEALNWSSSELKGILSITLIIDEEM